MNSRYCPMCFLALPFDQSEVTTISVAGQPLVRVHKHPCGAVAAQYAAATTQAAGDAVIGAITKRFPMVGALLKGALDLRKVRDAATNRRSA